MYCICNTKSFPTLTFTIPFGKLAKKSPKSSVRVISGTVRLLSEPFVILDAGRVMERGLVRLGSAVGRREEELLNGSSRDEVKVLEVGRERVASGSCFIFKFVLEVRDGPGKSVT